MSTIVKYILGAFATIIACFLLWYFSNIVTYILISAVLAIIGKPFVSKLSQISIRGWEVPKWLAALTTLAFFWAVFIAFVVIFVPLFFSKINEFSSLDVVKILESFDGPIKTIQLLLHNTFGISYAEFSIFDALRKELSEVLNIDTANKLLGSFMSIVGSTVIALFSITFITFFFLKESFLFVNMVVAVFPSRHEPKIRHAMNSATRLLIRYFTGLLVESLIIMTIISLVLLLWGVDFQNALFMGMIVGMLNVIPYIGPLIATSICILITIQNPIAGFSLFGGAVVVACTVLITKAMDDFIIQPILYSKQVKAHPLEIFIVILIAGSLAGVLGMLLAIPSYNVIRVFAKEFFFSSSLVRKLTENL